MYQCALIGVTIHKPFDMVEWPKFNRCRRQGRALCHRSAKFGKTRVVYAEIAMSIFILFSAVQVRCSKASKGLVCRPYTHTLTTRLPFVQIYIAGQLQGKPSRAFHLWNTLDIIPLLFFWAESIVRCVCYGPKR